MPDPKLTQISGIGPATAALLEAAGFTSVETVANSSVAKLAKVRGFGPARASAIIGSARSLLSTGAGAVTEKDKKKRHGKKKDKKGKKKKDGKKKRKK